MRYLLQLRVPAALAATLAAQLLVAPAGQLAGAPPLCIAEP